MYRDSQTYQFGQLSGTSLLMCKTLICVTVSHTFQVLVTSCLGGFLYGFSANAISGTVAQPTFIAKFLSGSNALELTDGMLGGYALNLRRPFEY
jgi:hypothetical protein